MSGRGRGGGGGSILNRLIVLVLVVTVAIVAILYLLSPSSPFKGKGDSTPVPTPITIGQIQKLYRLQTAQVTGTKIVEGQTQSALPFSSAKITYQVTLTMTAGIDMSKLKDNDLQINGDTLVINLPAPQVLNEEVDFVPIAENKGFLSGPSEKKDLPKIVVDEGRNKVKQAILEQGKLMMDARTNAEDEIRNLIFQIAPQYKKVVFTQVPIPSPSVRTSPSGPPR